MKNKNILVIDGSFIGHRSVYTLGKEINKKDVTLDTQEEMMLFENKYVSDIISIVTSFRANVIIDAVVIFIDNKSWRHNVPQHKPYYTPDGLDLSYKGNRKEVKKKSPLDYDNFHYCMDNVGKTLSRRDGFLVSSVKGFEADDGIYLAAQELTKDNNTVFIFANDGDIKQSVINDRVIYFNNSKSKDKPNKCIYVDGKLILPKAVTPLQMLQHKQNPMVSLLNQFSKIEIGNPNPGSIVRTVETGSIASSAPIYYGFEKSIIGDKKDNILPILGWYTAKGNLNRVLPKNINAAFHGMKATIEFDDELKSKYWDIVKDDDVELISGMLVDDILKTEQSSDIQELTKLFLINLITSTKQNGIAKNIYDHLRSNIQLMMLSVGSQRLLPEFNSYIKPLIIDTTTQPLNLDNNINTNRTTDILHNSIPDMEMDDVDKILDGL